MSTGDLHFSADVVGAIASLLERYCAETGSLAACLLDECGNQLVQGGAVEIRDHGETAALAAGAFAATRQLASRLGESEFEGLTHHGRQRHFYLSPVTRDFLLLSVFGQSVPAGIVRLCASRLAPRLRTALLAVTNASPPGEAAWDHGVDLARTAVPAMPAGGSERDQPAPEETAPPAFSGPFADGNIIPMPMPPPRLAER